MQYIICPCFSGDAPFGTNSLDTVKEHLMTEEYFAVDISSYEVIVMEKNELVYFPLSVV